MLPLATASTPNTTIALIAVIGLGAGQVGFLTLAQSIAMRLARRDRAGSDFTVQASLFQFWGTGIGAIGLGRSGQIGYPGLVTAGLLLTIAGVPLALNAHRRLNLTPDAEGPSAPPVNTTATVPGHAASR